MIEDTTPAPDSQENSPEAHLFPTLEEIAALLPQYEFHDVLGAGGMGAVYLARQPALDRWVAIKLLPEALSQNEEDAARFITEARSMAKLTHANIAAVHDFGQTEQGQLYLVMEHVNGLSLHQIIHGEHGLDPFGARALIAQLCEALEYAHSHGVIHRDIKPANILVTQDWQAKIIDFGLAQDKGSETAGGAEYGTPDYVAPERLREGATVDHRADIYSLGVVIHEMFTKQTPQAAGKAAGQGMPPEYATVVTRCTRMDQGLRFQRCREIQSFLNTAVNIPAAAAPPPPSVSKAPAAPVQRPVPPQLQARVRQPAPPKTVYRQSSGVPGWVWAAACALLLAGAGWFIRTQRGADSPAVAEAETPAPGSTVPSAEAPASSSPAPVVHSPAGPMKPEAGDFGVLKRLHGHKEIVYTSAILPDQRHAVSGGHDDTLRLWDVTTGIEVKSFPSPVGDIHGLQVANDGKRVLLYSFQTDQAAVFDLEAGKATSSVKAPTDRLTQAAWSGDQQSVYLLCNDTDGGVYHWDPAKGQALQQFPQWPRAAFQIIPLPADAASGTPAQVLVLGSTMKPNPNPGPGSMQPLVVDKPWAGVFSVPDHQHLRDLEEYKNFRNRLSLSPDGSRLMGGQASLYLLDLPGLATKLSINAPGNVNCSASAWTNTGRLIVGGYNDGGLAIMDAETGSRLKELNLGMRPNTISISKDDTWALVSGFPFNMQEPKPEDLELAVVRLPVLDMLGSEEGFLALAKRQLPKLDSLDPELAILRNQADEEKHDLTTKYAAALKRLAPSSPAQEQQAMNAEADAITQGGSVPDAATDAGTTGEHSRMRGIYRQQISQLSARRLNGPPPLSESMAASIKGLSFKRLQAGDRLGALRCTALLSTLGQVKAAPPVVAAAPRSSNPSSLPPPPPVAATPPAPVPTSPPTATTAAAGTNATFTKDVKLEVIISRPSTTRGGDFDDKTQVVTARTVFTNTSQKLAYEGYKVVFMLMAENLADSKIVQVIQRQEFSLTLAQRQVDEKEFPSITIQYDSTGYAKYGFKYDGWIVQVLGPGGEVVHTKCTSPIFEKLPEQIMGLRDQMFYDRKLKPVNGINVPRF